MILHFPVIMKALSCDLNISLQEENAGRCSPDVMGAEQSVFLYWVNQ